jgi:biotin carboxylase
MSKPKLLIAGGGYAEIPLIESAQAMGFYVITTGYFAKERGHMVSDLYEPADYSDKEQMLALAQKHSISAICSSCNDFSALSCAYVAGKLGLPGYDTVENAQIIHHKDKFRQFCQENALSVPKAQGFYEITEAIARFDSFTLPVIIKPIDLSGGKGITVVHSKADWESSIQKAFSISKAKKIVIEEYIEGSSHGFSALIQQGKVAFYFTDDEYYVPHEYWVSGTSAPGTITESEIKQFKEFSEKTVSLLRLCDGLFHIQSIIRDGKVYIIEVCRRPPGDLYLKFIQHATGYDFSKAIIQFISGKMNDSILQIYPQGFYARHCISSLKKGYISKLTFDKEITDLIIEEFRLWTADSYVENYVSQKAAILFMKFKKMDEMKYISANINENIHFEFQDVDSLPPHEYRTRTRI